MSGLWERRAGARVKLEQALQGATGRGLRGSRASSGPEEEYYPGTITPTLDMAELTVFILIVTAGQPVRIINK